MIKVMTGDNCKESGGIMPPQMSFKDKLENCKAIVMAGKYKDITIATFDPMLVDGIDTLKDITKTEVKYYLDNNEVPEDHLYIIYNYMAQMYDKLDSIKIAKEFGMIDGCCEL